MPPKALPGQSKKEGVKPAPDAGDVQVEAAPIKPPAGPLGGLRSSSSATTTSKRNNNNSNSTANSSSSSSSNNANSTDPANQNPTRAKLKYQPKTGIARKTKEERDTFNAKFKSAETTDIGSSLRGSRGGRGFRGRGRGGAGGDRGRRQDEHLTASGPFASGSLYSGQGGGAQSFRTGGGGYGYGARRPVGRMRVKGEDGEGDITMKEDYDPSDSDGEVKVDVERIDLGTDENNEEIKEATALPVRITRREHIDRAKMSNVNSSTTQDASEDSKGKGKEKVKKEEPSSPIAKRIHKSLNINDGVQNRKNKKDEVKYQKPLIQTAEDLEELERMREDCSSMLKELGPTPEADSNEDKNTADIENKPPLNHGLYLFQFPPAMPRLVSTEEQKVDLTKDTQDGNKFPPGIAGKLRVHKSGRVSMLWAGIEFEVHRGVDCEFLQEVVAVETTEESKESITSQATSLGQLKGKYIISPDIGQLLAEL